MPVAGKYEGKEIMAELRKKDNIDLNLSIEDRILKLYDDLFSVLEDSGVKDWNEKLEKTKTKRKEMMKI